jgi:hypothetical protein
MSRYPELTQCFSGIKCRSRQSKMTDPDSDRDDLQRLCSSVLVRDLGQRGRSLEECVDRRFDPQLLRGVRGIIHRVDYLM